MLYSRTRSNHNHIVITLFYYPDWVVMEHMVLDHNLQNAGKKAWKTFNLQEFLQNHENSIQSITISEGFLWIKYRCNNAYWFALIYIIMKNDWIAYNNLLLWFLFVCYRRMFPTFQVKISGMDPMAEYILMMDFVPVSSSFKLDSY